MPLPQDQPKDEAIALNVVPEKDEVPPPKPKAEPQESNTTPAPVVPPKAKPKETIVTEAPPKKQPKLKTDDIASYLKNDQNKEKSKNEVGLQIQNLLDEAQSQLKPEDQDEKTRKPKSRMTLNQIRIYLICWMKHYAIMPVRLLIPITIVMAR